MKAETKEEIGEVVKTIVIVIAALATFKYAVSPLIDKAVASIKGMINPPPPAGK